MKYQLTKYVLLLLVKKPLNYWSYYNDTSHVLDKIRDDVSSLLPGLTHLALAPLLIRHDMGVGIGTESDLYY